MKTKFFTVFIILIFACCWKGSAQGSGNAFEFNFNETQYVAGPADFSGITEFTLEGWAYIPVYNAPQFFCGSNLSECFEIHASPGGTIRFIPTSGSFFDIPAGSCPTAQWFHIACTYNNAGDCNMYINGIAIAVTNTSGVRNVINTTPVAVVLGRRGNPA